LIRSIRGRKSRANDRSDARAKKKAARTEAEYAKQNVAPRGTRDRQRKAHR
jgi:hypothetical protein